MCPCNCCHYHAPHTVSPTPHFQSINASWRLCSLCDWMVIRRSKDRPLSNIRDRIMCCYRVEFRSTHAQRRCFLFFDREEGSGACIILVSMTAWIEDELDARKATNVIHGMRSTKICVGTKDDETLSLIYCWISGSRADMRSRRLQRPCRFIASGRTTIFTNVIIVRMRGMSLNVGKETSLIQGGSICSTVGLSKRFS